MSFFGNMLNSGIKSLQDMEKGVKGEMSKLEYRSDEELMKIASSTSSATKHRRTAARMLLKERGY